MRPTHTLGGVRRTTTVGVYPSSGAPLRPVTLTLNGMRDPGATSKRRLASGCAPVAPITDTFATAVRTLNRIADRRPELHPPYSKIVNAFVIDRPSTTWTVTEALSVGTIPCLNTGEIIPDVTLSLRISVSLFPDVWKNNPVFRKTCVLLSRPYVTRVDVRLSALLYGTA